jgi:hypothetical protein
MPNPNVPPGTNPAARADAGAPGPGAPPPGGPVAGQVQPGAAPMTPEELLARRRARRNPQ